MTDEPGRRTDGSAPDVGPAADEPLGLTEATLEALLFVAERPLGRREIAQLAGVDRATVDARIGDLEVTLAARGIRLVVSGDRVELATASEAGRLIGRYIGAGATRLSAGGPRDPRDRRLPPARHEERRSSGSAGSTPTTRSARSSTAGSSSSSAGPRRRAGRTSTGPTSSSSSGSGSPASRSSRRSTRTSLRGS